jgi:hypothetical protein
MIVIGTAPSHRPSPGCSPDRLDVIKEEEDGEHRQPSNSIMM